MVVEIVDSARAPRIDLWVGIHDAAHATALGKCILGQLPAADRDEYLSRHPLHDLTRHTVVDRRRLRLPAPDEVAVDDEEYAIGIGCLAAPSHRPDVGGAVGVVSRPGRRRRTRRGRRCSLGAGRVSRALALGAHEAPSVVAAPSEIPPLVGRVTAVHDAAVATPPDARNGRSGRCRTVYDPCCREKGISVVDMGLLRSVDVNDGHARVELLLTSGWCPFAARVLDEVEDAIERAARRRLRDVEIVWDEAWTTDRLVDSARRKLRFLPDPVGRPRPGRLPRRTPPPRRTSR